MVTGSAVVAFTTILLVNSATSAMLPCHQCLDMFLLIKTGRSCHQAINDIRRKFEDEKRESVTVEKEKADKAVQEMERNCDQKLAELKEESQQYLMHIQEEHAALNVYPLSDQIAVSGDNQTGVYPPSSYPSGSCQFAVSSVATMAMILGKG
ncbi:hypothetical protein RHGRI_034029 [Rhododendron griersonianum]|uniref:Uncharacterized protein n=1 Tax=Rhododendron griersonianum TaxID=479676 RepID=A0AAV6I2V3_9ERIC|nr:hypothetical protein RHGRI_034029 [Rhododendron griersonianum]